MMKLNCQMVLILCQIFKIISSTSKKKKKKKKNETFTIIPPIHVYINRIKNSLAFEIKDGYKIELQTPETKMEKTCRLGMK